MTEKEEAENVIFSLLNDKNLQWIKVKCRKCENEWSTPIITSSSSIIPNFVCSDCGEDNIPDAKNN